MVVQFRSGAQNKLKRRPLSHQPGIEIQRWTTLAHPGQLGVRVSDTWLSAEAAALLLPIPRNSHPCEHAPTGLKSEQARTIALLQEETRYGGKAHTWNLQQRTRKDIKRMGDRAEREKSVRESY